MYIFLTWTKEYAPKLNILVPYQLFLDLRQYLIPCSNHLLMIRGLTQTRSLSSDLFIPKGYPDLLDNEPGRKYRDSPQAKVEVYTTHRGHDVHAT